MAQDSDVDDDYILARNGILVLSGEITQESVKPVIEWILRAPFYDNPPPFLKLIINSEGGELSAALGLIDIMKGSKKKIHTIGIGEISSCGLLIFMAGEKGHRTLTPNTVVLSHQFSWIVEGKEHELIASQQATKAISEIMIRHYRRCTNLSLKKIKSLLLSPSDVYLSAETALEYGICDTVKEVY